MCIPIHNETGTYLQYFHKFNNNPPILQIRNLKKSYREIIYQDFIPLDETNHSGRIPASNLWRTAS